MKKLIVVLTIVIFLLGSWNPALAKKKRPIDKIKYPQLNKFELPIIKKVQINNGIKIRLIKTEKLPLVDLRIIVKGGEVYDPSSKVGLTGVTARLLRIGGTKELEGKEVDKLLDSNGITISINSLNDYFSIYLTCLAENLDMAVSILSKMLLQPRFDNEKLEEIKTQMASSISRQNDEPYPINSREFNKLIYGAKSPFAAIQEYEHLDNIGKEDIFKVYKQFFAPDNMLVGVTGPVEIKDVKGIFKKYFGKWNYKASIPSYPQVKEQKHDFKVAFAEKSTLNQSYLSIGHLGVKEDFAEKAKMRIFNLIFAGGFDSRLVTRVRTKMGLTYGIFGGIRTNYLYPGKTYVSTFTKSKSTIKAIKAIFEEIDIIRKEKVSEKELKDAKDYFFNSYVFEFSSPDKILYNQLQREFYNLPKGYSKKLIENIKKVTADDVLEIAQKYLHPDKMIIFILGKEKDLDGKLSDLGRKIKKIDISIKPPALKEKIPAPTAETLQKGSQVILNLSKKTYKGYKRLKSLKTVADMNMSMQGQTLNMGIKSTNLYPDKVYVEISVMGMKIERIINGEKGVTKQMGQEQPISEKDIEKGKFSDLFNVFNYQDKYKFQYLKEKEIKGVKYDVVYLFDAKKNWAKFFINKKTGLIEIEEKLSNFPGKSGVAQTVNSNFKTIKGVPFAFKSETFIKDKKVVEVTVKEIKVNPKVEPSIFKIQKKK